MPKYKKHIDSFHSGNDFENYLNNYFQSLKKAGKPCDINKINNLRSNGRGKNKYSLIQKLRTDFEGYTSIFQEEKFNRPVYIAVEAKRTKKDFFQIMYTKNHQIDHLYKVCQLNGLGYLVIGFEEYIYALYMDKELYDWISPVLDYYQYKTRCSLKKSISIKDCDKLCKKSYNFKFTYANFNLLGV